ncbi:MAG: Tat pathway signal sequence domain protein [Caulobacteraceae bacterium]
MIPLAHAYAQGGGGGGDDDTSKKKRDSEWNLRQAPLPGQKNAGPCPYVKVLYDAARYEEFKDGQEASNSVGYTGEIEGVAAQCAYRTTDPIKVNMRLTFELGRGPQATESKKTYTYWVAVTHRNRAVLAKEYFTLPVSFPAGKDRVTLTDDVNGIVIPRADATVAGDNFEILVGFDVTPQMADFNREGKRFRINAGAAAAGGGGASGGR